MGEHSRAQEEAFSKLRCEGSTKLAKRRCGGRGGEGEQERVRQKDPSVPRRALHDGWSTKMYVCSEIGKPGPRSAMPSELLKEHY